MIGGKIRKNRRAFLRAAGTVAVGLPFLEGLPERSAWAQTENPVFGFFICTSCGVVQRSGNDPERFWPSAEGVLTRESMEASAAERSTGLLAEYADRLLMVRGVNYPHRSNGCGHAIGLAQCLTAAQWTGSNNNAVASGISADTLIADELNPAGVEPLSQLCIDSSLTMQTAQGSMPAPSARDPRWGRGRRGAMRDQDRGSGVTRR
jgi:hypothetical protein